MSKVFTALPVLLLFCACATTPSVQRGPVVPVEGKEVPDSKPIRTFDPPSQPQFQTEMAGATNVRANQDSSGRDQNETVFAINPTDPLNMIGGANDARLGTWAAGVYVTSDGGQTWTDGVQAARKYVNQGDPILDFCGDGTAIFGYLDYNGAFQPHRLVVANSTDDGATWSPVGVVYEGTIPFADRPMIGCTPDTNRVHISWTHAGIGSGPIRTAYSDDYGQTWTGYTNISGNGVQGSVVVPGDDDESWVFWSGPTGVEYARTVNGGSSWSAAATASSVTGISDTSFRRNSHPSAAIDNSGGSHDGNVYAVWADQRDGDPDIYFTRTTDGGASWDTPYRLNDDAVANGADQFFPWIAVDDSGLVHVAWYDRRDDPDNQRFHMYIASSRDGGISFDRNLRITDEPSNGSLSGFLGDYSALDARDGIIVPLWADLRPGTGESDVYIEIETAFDFDIVSNVAFSSDKQSLSFTDQNPRLGPGVRYDVILGDAADLQTASPWASASCNADDLTLASATVTDVPAAGQAYYVIVRAQSATGVGSYGSSSAHPDTRDELDDTSPCL